jgi:GrpB-like predicted nucleotidyltransferase (UPF0157 family)
MPAPLILVEYDPRWPEIFAVEQTALQASVGQWLVRIEHIGSTSVPGLRAKPIIDILGGLNSLSDSPAIIQPLTDLGYSYIPEYESDLPERRFFNKHPREASLGSFGGYGFHLHVVEIGSYFWRRHLAFRDYLRTHSQAADEYAHLKTRLAAECGSDRERYTDSKTEFVRKIEALAGVLS